MSNLINNRGGLEQDLVIEDGFIAIKDSEMFCYPNWISFTDRLVVPAFCLLKVHRKYPLTLRCSKNSSLVKIIPAENEYGLGESHDMEDDHIDEGPDLASIPIKDKRLIYDVVTFVLFPKKYTPKVEGSRLYEFKKGFQTSGEACEAVSLVYFKDGINEVGGCHEVSLIPSQFISKNLIDFFSKAHEVWGYTNLPENPKRTTYGMIHILYEEASSTVNKLVRDLEKRFRTKIS